MDSTLFVSKASSTSFQDLCNSSKKVQVGKQVSLDRFVKQVRKEFQKLEKELKLVIWMVRNIISFEAL